MNGRRVFSSILYCILLLFFCSFCGYTHNNLFLRDQSTSEAFWTQFGRTIGTERGICVISSTILLKLVSHISGADIPWGYSTILVSTESLSSIVQWNKAAICSLDQLLCPVNNKPVFYGGNRKTKRHKRLCNYYNNSTAAFRAQLVGDLVYKLNPGPDQANNYHHLNHSTGNPNITSQIAVCSRSGA